MTQRLGLAKTLRFVVIKPDTTAEAQGGERRRRKGLFWGIKTRSRGQAERRLWVQ